MDLSPFSSSPLSNLACEMEAMNTHGDSSDSNTSYNENIKEPCRTPKRRLNFAGLFPNGSTSSMTSSPARDKHRSTRAPGSPGIKHLLHAPFTSSPNEDSPDNSMWDSPDMIPTRLYPAPTSSPSSSSVGSFSEFLDPNSMDIQTPSSRRFHKSKRSSLTRTPSGSAKSAIRCSLKFSPAGIKRPASSPMKTSFTTSPKRKALCSSPLSPMKCSPYAPASNPLSPFKTSSMPAQNLFNAKRSNLTKYKIDMNPCLSNTSKKLNFSFSEENMNNNEVNQKSPGKWRRCHSDSEIKSALHRSAENVDLIGDFSKPYCLPVFSGRHSDLRSITPATMIDLMKGLYSAIISKVIIIDCRYPYEYQGGHITGAMNIYSKPTIITELFDKASKFQPEDDSKRVVVIFHCEFSSERGPKLMRFMRTHDRSMNKDHYPKLHFPELYLLDGGYKAFFELSSAEFCSPKAYKPMLDEAHSEDLKFFRRKSRSLNGGSKQRNVPNRSLSFC